jgi:hypothetical protein
MAIVDSGIKKAGTEKQSSCTPRQTGLVRFR